MIRLLVLLLLCTALVACANARRDRLAFDGQYFRSNAAAVDRDDRRAFTLEVRPASASIEGAQEAGRHEATKYCIENYGNSAVIWTVGPDDDPESYTLDGDSLVLVGTCEG